MSANEDDGGALGPPPEPRSKDVGQTAGVDEDVGPTKADADGGGGPQMAPVDVPPAPAAADDEIDEASTHDPLRPTAEPTDRPTASPRQTVRLRPHTSESGPVDQFFDVYNVSPHAADPRSIVKIEEIAARRWETEIVLEWMPGERGNPPPDPDCLSQK